MSNRAAVVGIGALPVGKYPDMLEHEMVIRAFLEAVHDAGIRKSEIDSLIFAHPRPYTEQRYFATFITAYLDLPLRGTVAEVLGNGMTGSLALDAAVDQVTSGKAQVAVALGVSRETHVSTPEHMRLTMRAVGDVDFHTPFGVTPIAWYAMNATRYLHDYQVSLEDLASIAVKNRHHAAQNPLAQFHAPISVDEVIHSRPIVAPLTLLQVPPRSDGAVAIIVTSEARARQLRRDPVYVAGRGFFHEGVHQVSSTPRSLTRFESAEQAAVMAYMSSGIGPEDVDFAEVYAPCTIVEAILSESLGLLPPGEGARRARAGETSVGGALPISPSGGCLSRGHPPMVTPLYNAYEAVLQLRGQAGARQVQGAHVGITTGELGDYNSTLIHVFTN